MATYRTRSNTAKLQRLIEFLKERDCESASNLETSAAVFLDDVKPKYKPGEIPFYDGTESDDGSSYVEEEKDDDWGSDWEEEWDDCATDEPLPAIETLEVPPPPPTPPKPPTPPPPPPPVVKAPSPPKVIPEPKKEEVPVVIDKTELLDLVPVKTKTSHQSAPPPVRRESRNFKPADNYKPAVVLSGVEKSSDIASPLMKFPTLPVSIPNFFGSNTTTNVGSPTKRKEKKKSQVPEDAVESVLVDSMTVVTAVAVPIDASMAQLSSKNGISKTETEIDIPPIAPPRRNSKESLVARSCPVSIKALPKQEEVLDFESDSTPTNTITTPTTTCSSSFERIEKSPLRSILKKSTPHSSSTDVSETLPVDSERKLNIVSSSPSKVVFSIPERDQFTAEIVQDRVKKSPEPSISYAQVTEVISRKPEEQYREVTVTIQGPFQEAAAAIEEVKRSKQSTEQTQSKLAALIKESEAESPKTKAKKHVTLQVPPQEPKTGPPKPKPPGSPTPKRSMVKPQPPIQYNVPDGAKIPKVGGQRSKKPTLASQWRMQKEKQKLEEQVLLERMETFNDNWPYLEDDSSVPSITALSEAGFFYLGLNDCVQCSTCEAVLRGWKEMEPSNDPWVQHELACPTCPQLEKNKTAAKP